MKVFLILIATSIGLCSSQAAEIQSIDCQFSASENKDHILVNLNSTDQGTFHYSTETEQSKESESSGQLPIFKVSDSKFIAKMKSQELGNNIEIEFQFSIPKAILFKPNKSFKLEFETSIKDGNTAPLQAKDELICSSTLNSNSK